MLHRMLSLAGYRTALYTSPHLVSFTERIRIDEQEISPNEVMALAKEVEDRTLAAEVSLTFFEFVTVMAFVHFARGGIDVAVVEVGLGGRLDATNLVKPIVTVITTVSKDHEAYLGSDLLSIAREKGGIIKPGVPVVCGALSREVSAQIQNIAETRGSPAYFLETDFKFSLKNDRLFDYTGIKQNFLGCSVALRGRHQKHNATVALSAIELTADPFPVDEAVIRQGLETVVWPARFEIMLEDPTVVVDGAHNGEGVKALLEVMGEFRQGRKIKLLFACMADKDWRMMLEELTSVMDEVVLTQVGMERSAEPEQLASHLRENLPHRVILEARVALRALLDGARSDEIILVAGSLYLAGEVRPFLQEIAQSKAADNKTLYVLT
jgi:dihydrofolate synthase / folylpolyglutamate synthase